MDPDWNPSTDSQARERAYRIGQQRDVVVYRFIVRGTIEEKVYHRQIYKQFLTDKVLKDPNHQRVFSEKDLRNLFSLDDGVMNKNGDGIISGIGQDKDEHNKNGKGKNSKLTETDAMFSHLDATITSEHVNGVINGSNDKEVVIKSKKERKQTDETEILSILFSSNGIASAFRHDCIEDVDENEKIKMEEAAKKVAKRALKALEKSRKEINSHPITQPTWTGSQGFNYNAIDRKRKKFGNHRDLIHIIRSQLDKDKDKDKNKDDNKPIMIKQQNGPLSSASLLAHNKSEKSHC